MEQQLLGYEDTLYILDRTEHIAGRFDRVVQFVHYCTSDLAHQAEFVTQPLEQIRPYLRRGGFEYMACIVEFEHDLPLASTLIERWRPEPHTFQLSCRKMTITLQDVAYQLELKIDSDPVSGCICGWEQQHQGRTIEELHQQLLGAISGPDDRQSQIRWTVKLTWFHNTVCGELEQDATVERLLRYTRRYIMKLIGGILFPDASDSRVHIRWLPLLEDLEMCGGLSWGLTVLAWLYCQMCCATEHRQCNLGGCINLLLSWAYHHIPLLRPDGFDTCRFLLVERWVHYLPDNAKGEGRLRNYISTLNGIGMLNTPYADLQLIGLVPLMIAEAEASAAVVCPLLCFAIVEWHQVDRVVHQFGSLQHILTKPLNIDKMHKLNGWFGRDEWFLQLLGGWHELWNARADHRLHIHHHIDLRPSLPYMVSAVGAHGVVRSG
ncbi:protein MAIN-LIKE 1-like [Arachis hypogaea]|uniref:protein MAIN-LIKE 1-like n=1 Tax=Arachis hypogaea TaxID=3818 RepID=UPI0007AF1DE4|nr:protein MAIN-LIKE 1-like [Arachis hypogaea]QHO25717.1 uncharacterized protein DS421_12g383390 [Arachis hypogaea]